MTPCCITKLAAQDLDAIFFLIQIKSKMHIQCTKTYLVEFGCKTVQKPLCWANIKLFSRSLFCMFNELSLQKNCHHWGLSPLESQQLWDPHIYCTMCIKCYPLLHFPEFTGNQTKLQPEDQQASEWCRRQAVCCSELQLIHTAPWISWSCATTFRRSSTWHSLNTQNKDSHDKSDWPSFSRYMYLSHS